MELAAELLPAKCAPALAAGCAVVVKPSEFSSVSSLEFAKLTKEAGLPDGVLNVITGYGHEIGRTLVEHPDVAQITFTGSDVTGARIYEAAARQMKRVAMELGGKSPNIVFADADLDAAVPASCPASSARPARCVPRARGCWCRTQSRRRSPKRCSACALHDQGRRSDGPADTQMGPISTRPQFGRSWITSTCASADGARCILGGKAAEGPASSGGQFVGADDLHRRDQPHAHCAGGGVRPGPFGHRL